MDIELSERARRVLQRLHPAAHLGIEAVTLDALRLRFRRVADELGTFEAQYGRGFDQFAADWGAGSVANPFSRDIERDFMQWEALVAERQELLGLILELVYPDASALRPRDV